jgi:serine/threonine protein kinase
MVDDQDSEAKSLEIAQHWCNTKGQRWSILAPLGKGGTAPVFEVTSPEGPRALKIYDAKFSSGEKGEIEQRRIDQQLALRGHNCPNLVQIYDGGSFEGRLFLLMGRAPGTELERCLPTIPRAKIRQIVDQVTRAAIFLRGKGLCHRDIKAANIFISEDLETCTLLDISVIRNVTDPIGLGTDHEGQLPVVATARYSPPEYLFRLLEPSADSWHALNVYQLGALLHDLIMREPLFQAEYLRSTENRYRFAWIVATVEPNLQADDVDRDLLFTARRALDKNWQRRSALKLEDFLADVAVRKTKALQVLGIGSECGSLQEAGALTVRLQRTREVADDLQHALNEYLYNKGITSYHEVLHGSHDTSKLIVFKWSSPADLNVSQQVELRIHLQLLAKGTAHRFDTEVQLAYQDRSVSIVLPELQDEEGAVQRLLGSIVDGFGQLAMDVLRRDTKVE